MSNVVVSEFITLDGVFQDPGGVGEFELGGWTSRAFRGDQGMKFKFDEVTAAGALLLGRVTYEGFAAAWPTMEGTGAFGEKMNTMPKYVVSTTLKQADWEKSTIIASNVADEVRRLKQEVDGDILIYGSGQLTRSLMELDLIDEYRLMVYPIVLGSGKRLFTEMGSPAMLQLEEVMQDGDCVTLILRPNRTAA